jgi:hypothetical protein
VTQQDALVDHMQADVGPEVGTTYRVDVRKADNTLIHSTAGITGNSWTRSRASLISDFGVTGGLHNGYINVTSVRDAYDSYQNYRIDFVLNASNPVSRDLALSYSITAPGGSYPAASAFDVLYKFNEADNTTSPIANTGTAAITFTGTAENKVSTEQAKFGTASLRMIQTAGTGDVQIADSIFSLANGGAMTIGCWIRPGTAGDFNKSVRIDLDGNYGLSNLTVRFAIGPEYVGIQVTGSRKTGGVLVAEVYPVLTPDEFQHLEVGINGSTIYLFINGTLLATRTISTTALSPGNGSFEIPELITSDAVPAYMDNFYLIKGTCVHTASFTPPGDFT